MPIEMYRCNCNRSVELRPDGYCTSCWSKVGRPFYSYNPPMISVTDEERWEEIFGDQRARPAMVLGKGVEIFPNEFETTRHIYLPDGSARIEKVVSTCEYGWEDCPCEQDTHWHWRTDEERARRLARKPRKQIWLPGFTFHVGVAAWVAYAVGAFTDTDAPFIAFFVLLATWALLTERRQ